MRVLIVAGEASGDAHAAKVARRLIDGGARVAAVGGAALRDTGATSIASIDELAVIGFVEVAQRLPRLLALLRQLEKRLRAGEFDLALTVDYPGFNLRLAARARRAGVPVLHYIGPQVWAWRAHRLQVLRRVATHVALVLPFEKPLYDAAGVAATYVGHPLLDDPDPPHAPDRDLGLFPGSRTQEIRRHLPLLLDAWEHIRAQRPQTTLWVSQANTAPEAMMRDLLRARGLDPDACLSPSPARVVMARSRALLVASGTATLEAALASRPFAVFYRTHPFNYALARRLVQVPHVALANLVAGEAIVREYVQGAATPAALATEALRLIDDQAERARQNTAWREVRQRLGPAGASERVAALAVTLGQGIPPGERS